MLPLHLHLQSKFGAMFSQGVTSRWHQSLDKGPIAGRTEQYDEMFIAFAFVMLIKYDKIVLNS